ncbi:Oligosaccharides import ATP-binding protein MsmX [subsurface metagenome]
MSRVSINHVWKIYEGNVIAVRDASFTCEDGEFLAILGPSGSGKSSILRMLAGLEEITRGEILFDGKVVNKLNPSERNIALAFESYALYPRLTIYENIAFPLRAQGLDKPEIDKKVKLISEALDLADFLKKRPSSLSGGHQQRISLARALVREPNVTLLDEPISHMDQRVRVEIRARIRRLHDELKTTTMYVTHDQAEAISLCDRLVVLNLAEVQQVGTVDEIWNQPANKFVASFVGDPRMNFINGKVESPQHVSIPTKEGKKTFESTGEIDQKYVGSEEITIGVRPQQIELSLSKQQEASIPGSVKIIEFRGDDAVLAVELEDFNNTRVRVVVPLERAGYVGDTVWLEFKPEIIHLFDKEVPIIR